VHLFCCAHVALRERTQALSLGSANNLRISVDALREPSIGLWFSG
jgi:hypothetical protein